MAGAHDVSGTVSVIQAGNDTTLRFENFKVINGPDVHIYLSADSGAHDFIDLGAMKANRGNINYTIPAGTDLGKYNKVLIYCKAYSVLFSSADLVTK